MRALLLTWGALLLLLAVEFGASFLPVRHAWRPLLLLPSGLMLALVAVLFMQVRIGPRIVRLFVVIALLWLLILLALGSLDPLTRTNYLVPGFQPE